MTHQGTIGPLNFIERAAQSEGRSLLVSLSEKFPSHCSLSNRRTPGKPWPAKHCGLSMQPSTASRLKSARCQGNGDKAADRVGSLKLCSDGRTDGPFLSSTCRPGRPVILPAWCFWSGCLLKLVPHNLDVEQSVLAHSQLVHRFLNSCLPRVLDLALGGLDLSAESSLHHPQPGPRICS